MSQAALANAPSADVAHRVASRVDRVAPLVWSATAALARVLWLARHPPIAAWDGAIYHRTALRIAHGQGFIDSWNNRPPFHPTAFYPVGFPALLGALYALLGDHAWVLGALNVAAGAIATYGAVVLARRAFGAWPAHIAGALSALAPGAVIYASAYMTEPVSAALLVVAMLLALRHARTAGASSALAAGLLLGFGGLVRPPALLLAPVIAACAVPRRTVAATVRTFALVGAASLAVVAPWTARNCARLDGCAVVSVNGGSNLFIGTDPAAHGGYRDLHPGEGCDRVFGEVAKDGCYRAMAIRRIAHAPFAWIALAPAKLHELLAYEATPVSYLHEATHGAAFGFDPGPWYRAITGFYRALLALAVVALVPVAGDRRRSTRERAMTLAVLGAFLLIHIVFFGADRYHFVFTPLVCVLAGGAFRRGVDADATAV